MNIGLSLPLGYLTSANDTANARCLLKALGTPGDGLTKLKNYGVNSIELQDFRADASALSLLNAAHCILNSGMSLTLHGYLTKNGEEHIFSDSYSQLLPTMDYLKDHQPETIMVVHALAYPRASYSTILQSTALSLQRLIDGIQAFDLPLKIGLEINRYHGVDSPGITYDGLLEITRYLDNAHIGFCWDMGHTQSSVLQNKLPAFPPPEFIRNVIHTHVHGLAEDGDTHRSVVESNTHIASAVNQLRNAGYNGTYNLELYPQRWGVGYPVQEAILGSITWLQKYLNKPAIK